MGCGSTGHGEVRGRVGDGGREDSGDHDGDEGTFGEC